MLIELLSTVPNDDNWSTNCWTTLRRTGRAKRKGKIIIDEIHPSIPIPIANSRFLTTPLVSSSSSSAESSVVVVICRGGARVIIITIIRIILVIPLEHMFHETNRLSCRDSKADTELLRGKRDNK
ncbi:unnamed protein product [Orchesella dallaii]|uniref:Uncharacterized protein n=1 Tax=Orchesella dallaii TaxID=48710 RepID=A0ABP1RSN7_9HEXA